MDFDLPEDVELYAGFVFHSTPHRHKAGKFYVSLEEYPFHLWPPYVTAGAYVLSRAALIGIWSNLGYFVSAYQGPRPALTGLHEPTRHFGPQLAVV